MEGEVGTTATASPPLLLESVSAPLGSPEETPNEIHSLSSDDDHDHDHDHDADLVPQDHDVNHDEAHDPVYDLTVQTDDLKQKIIKQVEYYFSDENLPTDKYMISLIKKNKEGFVPIKILASFRKMKKLTLDHELISAALNDSSFLVVSSDGKKVKRLNPFQMSEIQDSQLSTVLVENLPEDHSLVNIQKIFGEVGRIRKITFGDPHAGGVSKKGSKTDILISSKLHALVEYDTEEAAEKAVANFNNEHDWRNGMHVKRLKRVVKPTQKKTWKEHEFEKSSSARVSTQTVDEDAHHSQDQHDLLPDEEDAEHVSKDKNGQRGRNRGRSRRNRYHNSNGLGHGTTSSVHAVEPSKPPPGPKMPDGTRGFTMGRGRHPVSHSATD
ncbi:La-related protein 6A [Linum perenne]